MKTAELTVHLESPFLERLEQLAKLIGKTVAEIVELHIKVQMGWRPELSAELLPEVRALKGVVPLPADLDYKTILHEAWDKKYGGTASVS